MVRMAVLSVVVAGAAWAVEPTQSSRTAGETKEGVVDPKADAVLRRMSDYVAGLKSVRLTTNAVDEKFTREGQKIQEVNQSKVTMQRPGDLRVERISPKGHTIFVDDGQKFTVYNKEKNVYATAPAPADIDAAIDNAEERLQISAPGGDLLVSDPYNALIEGTVTGRYIGLEPIDGQMAHHLAFTRNDLDWQLWVKDGNEAVPLRYVITSKDLPGHPQFTLEIRDWQGNANVSAEDFKVTVPQGAKKVAFAPPQQQKGERP